MVKEVKLSFALNLALACVVLAWKSVANFFGTGLAFVAVAVLCALLLIVFCTNINAKNRTADLFILACVFTAVQFLMFFVLEINAANISSGAVEGFGHFQNFVSVLAIFYFIYVVFRWVTEINGTKVVFVERMLGVPKREKKVKKAKELSNGSLMEKPNKQELKQGGVEQSELMREENVLAREENEFGMPHGQEQTAQTSSVQQIEVVVPSQTRRFDEEDSEN